MTSYDPDSLFGHGIIIEALEKRVNELISKHRILEGEYAMMAGTIKTLENKLDMLNNNQLNFTTNLQKINEQISKLRNYTEKKDCNECELYGECDHQGAYQKDGKWCYEDLGGEKEKTYKDLPKLSNDGTYEIIEFGKDSEKLKLYPQKFDETFKNIIKENKKLPVPADMADLDELERRSKLPEYSLTQKGLDAVDQIIKRSPQYKQLIEDIIRDLEEIKELIEEWRKRCPI